MGLTIRLFRSSRWIGTGYKASHIDRFFPRIDFDLIHRTILDSQVPALKVEEECFIRIKAPQERRFADTVGPKYRSLDSFSLSQSLIRGYDFHACTS